MNSLSTSFGQRLATRGRCTAWAVMILGLALALGACQRKTPEDTLREAYEMFLKGDILGAEMKYEKLLQKNPEGQIALAAHAGLAMCYMNEGEYDRGREQLDQVIKMLGPQSPDAIQFHSAKIDSYFREKKPEKAIEVAETTSATLHGAPEAVRKNFRVNMLDFYMTANQEDKVTQTAHQTIREWPDDPELHLIALERLVLVPHKKQQWGKAIEIYEDYLKEHSNTVKKPELLFGIGTYQKMLGNTDKAQASFDASETELRKQIQGAMGAEAKGELILKLARVQQGRGNTTSATANLQRAIKDFPGSDTQAFARFMLSEIALQNNNTSEALGMLDQIVRERPDTNFAYSAAERMRQINEMMRAPTTATQAMNRGTTATLMGDRTTTAVRETTGSADQTTPTQGAASPESQASEPPAAQPPPADLQPAAEQANQTTGTAAP